VSLETAYLIAQIFGGLAVIGSLIFVGLEVRRNTKAYIHQLGIERTSFFAKSNDWIIENETLRKVLMKGSQSFKALTPEEKLIFSTYHQHWIGAMIALWSQEEHFEVAPKYSADFYNTWERFSRTPGCREWWAAIRLGISSEFLARFDALMKHEPAEEESRRSDT